MPLTAQNSPLVNGAAFDLKNGLRKADPGRLRVVRAFCIDGVRQEVGDHVDLPPGTAAELISAGKIEREPVPAQQPESGQKPPAGQDDGAPKAPKKSND